MTDDQKYLAELLITGKYYLREVGNHKGKTAWKLMQGVEDPVRYISKAAVKKYRKLLKKDKRGRYTLNLSHVRQLSGNTYINKLYKNKLNPATG